MFWYRGNKIGIILLVYVDDQAILSAGTDGVNCEINKLKSSFKQTELSNMNYYLGASFECKGCVRVLTKSSFCIRIIEQVGIDLAKPASSPMAGNIDAPNWEAVARKAKRLRMVRNLFRPLIESPIFLGTQTRPNFFFFGGASKQVRHKSFCYELECR